MTTGWSSKSRRLCVTAFRRLCSEQRVSALHDRYRSQAGPTGECARHHRQRERKVTISRAETSEENRRICDRNALQSRLGLQITVGRCASPRSAPMCARQHTFFRSACRRPRAWRPFSARRRSQVVRQRSAKPPFGGSNPPGASRNQGLGHSAGAFLFVRDWWDGCPARRPLPGPAARPHRGWPGRYRPAASWSPG